MTNWPDNITKALIVYNGKIDFDQYLSNDKYSAVSFYNPNEDHTVVLVNTPGTKLKACTIEKKFPGAKESAPVTDVHVFCPGKFKVTEHGNVSWFRKTSASSFVSQTSFMSVRSENIQQYIGVFNNVIEHLISSRFVTAVCHPQHGAAIEFNRHMLDITSTSRIFTNSEINDPLKVFIPPSWDTSDWRSPNFIESKNIKALYAALLSLMSLPTRIETESENEDDHATKLWCALTTAKTKDRKDQYGVILDAGDHEAAELAAIYVEKLYVRDVLRHMLCQHYMNKYKELKEEYNGDIEESQKPPGRVMSPMSGIVSKRSRMRSS